MPGFGLVKLSIVFFYRRIFCSFSRGAFDIATKIMIVIILLWTIGFTLALVFECGDRFWALFGSAQNLIQYCVKTLQLAQAFVISDVITDLMILCLPLPMVCDLRWFENALYRAGWLVVDANYCGFRSGSYTCQLDGRLLSAVSFSSELCKYFVRH